MLPTMKKNKRVLCAIITATAVNLTAVAPAYAAARELPSELPRSPAPNPPAANDPIYNQKQKPNFNKLAKKIAKNPANIRKILNPYSFGGSLALDLIVDQVGKLIDSGGEIKWKDKDGRDIDPDDVNDATPSGHTNTQIIPPGTHPYEFAFDGQSFSTAEEAHRYIIRDYLTKNGLRHTRRDDGIYYSHLKIYLGKSSYISGGIGIFEVFVQNVANKHAKYSNDVGGNPVTYSGQIYYRGEILDKTVEVSPSFQQDLVKQLESVLESAYDQQLSSDTDPMLDPKEEATADAKEQAKADAKEQANAKADPKPQELPTFCDWAAPVCGLIDWLKEEPQLPEPTKPKLVENDTSWLAPAEKSWVNFGSATCPQDIIIPIQFGNNTQNITISYVPFCKFAQMIKPAVILGAYLSALMIIVGGRQREG